MTEQAHLVVWLDLEQVSDPEAYLLWLQRLLIEAPAELRFIAVDSRDAPAYEPLHKVEPVRVHTEPCDLDVLAAVVDLAEAAGKDTPGGQFRVLLAKLGQAIAAGEMTRAVPLAALALEVAAAQGWSHLGAVVHMMLAGAYSALGQPLEAAKAYTEAESLGAECEAREQGAKTDGKPSAADQAGQANPQANPVVYGRHLRLQARLGQGASMVAYGAWRQAATVYLNAAPLAASLEDARAELDCFRLASACAEHHGETSEAWDCGMRGFNVGITMDEETRSTSSMPYLCEHLERFTTRHAAYRAHRGPLLEHVEKLLGPEWRPRAVSNAGAVDS
jgi:hypothetical protein